MAKLIFFDIDGTLVMSNATPSKRTVEAIRATHTNGRKVFLTIGQLETYADEAVITPESVF